MNGYHAKTTKANRPPPTEKIGPQYLILSHLLLCYLLSAMRATMMANIEYWQILNDVIISRFESKSKSDHSIPISHYYVIMKRLESG